MSVKLAINGFGRIGRLVARIASRHPQIELVGINDVTRQLSVSIEEIKSTSENFAKLAGDLQHMVSWFKL